MELQRLTIRAAEVVAGAGFVVVAMVVLVETIKLGPGWGRDGPQPGFFPFILAVVIGLGGLGTLVQGLRSADSRPFFEVRQEMVDLAQVGIPLALAIASIPFLGLYIMAVLYVGLFTAWYGRFRWYLSFPAGLVLAGTLYWGLERGFLISMPKSMWYGTVLPF